MRKRVFGHMRTSAQTDQSLHCPQTESLDTTERKNGELRPRWCFAHAPDDLNLRILRMFEGTFCTWRGRNETIMEKQQSWNTAWVRYWKGKRVGTMKNKTAQLQLCRTKRKDIFGHAQKQIILRMRKLSPGHSLSVNSVVSNDSVSGQWRPWWNCAYAQSHQGLRCRICPETRFCMARPKCNIWHTNKEEREFRKRLVRNAQPKNYCWRVGCGVGAGMRSPQVPEWLHLINK